MRVPWIPAAHGKRTGVLAELIDVFPTVAEVLGVALPAGEHIDGKSLVPVLMNPGDRAAAAALKPRAISQYFRCPANDTVPWARNSCLFVDRTLFNVVGYTMRVAGHRFTEWRRWNATGLAPDLTPAGLVGTELYSHQPRGLDYSFDEFENTNEAIRNPSLVASLQGELHAALRAQNRVATLPRFG